MENAFTIVGLIIFIVCLIFPIYHMVHALIIVRNKPYYLKTTKELREKKLSILVPCYNEEHIIKTTILGIERLNYSNYEFILINDGSLDHTFEIMAGMLDLEMQPRSLHHILEFSPVKGVYRSKKNPRVIVIDKMNGGKADSLNAGISYASSEIVITLDADSLLDEKALTMINRVFEDENLIAAGGTVHVLQGRKFNKGLLKPTLKVKSIVKFQILEYLRGFYIYKASLAKADALAIISGAFGIFKKDVLLAVGGYRKTVGEDIDITLKVQNYKNKRKGLKVAYIPEAVCYTEVPETWKDFYKQRIRWQKAFVDCLILYFKELILTILTKRLSFFFLVDAILVGTVSSYITVLGFVFILLFLGFTKLMILFTVISVFISLLYNFVSVGISYAYKNGFNFKDFLSILAFIILDLFFFRFITLFCTLYGTIQYFIRKDDWNKVARTGREYNIEQAG